MTTLLEKLLRNIAPHECIICCKEGYIICQACAFDVIDEGFSHCFSCEVPTIDYVICQQCINKVPLSHAFVLGSYEKELKQLVGLLKFDHVRQVASDIARVWDMWLPILPETTIVTHIPTAGRRQRQRGFDQAQLLAQNLAKQRNLRYAPLLDRTNNSKQVGASRQQRFEQAVAMFKARSHSLFEDKTIMLVDDVITTGAIMQAAASLLRLAGAKQVIAIAVARQTAGKTLK